MSVISIFSYLILFSIFLFNSFKKLNGLVLSNLFFLSLVCYVAAFSYFSNTHEHYLFPVIATLIYISYFSMLIFKSKKIESANLFVNAGQILLPIYLVVETNNIWEILVVILLLESVRLISSSGRSERRTTYSVINFVNSNYKIFLLSISFICFFLITGRSSVSVDLRINTYFVILPLVLMYITSFIFMGGVNSSLVEVENIKNYKSKNYLAYIYIYQFLVPFVMFGFIKRTLAIVSFDVYQDLNFLLMIMSALIISYLVSKFITNKLWSYRLQITRSLVFIPLALEYLNTPEFSEYNLLLIGTFVVLLQKIILLCLEYKVRFKKEILIICTSFLFVSPISPLFYLIFQGVDKIEVTYKNINLMLIFVAIIILNFMFERILKHIKTLKKDKKFNFYANQRIAYLLCGSFVTLLAIIYEKV
jgi:hypothetical protein